MIHRFVLAGLGLTLSTPVLAQDARLNEVFDKFDVPAGSLVDCRKDRKAAVVEVPKSISGFARIVCTPTTAYFMAKRGWHWHVVVKGYPKFHIDARRMADKADDPPAYFKSISARRVDFGKTLAADYPGDLGQSEIFIKAHFATISSDNKMIEIRLVDNNDRETILHVIDKNEPFPYAYLGLIPKTPTMFLLNDLSKFHNSKPASR